MTDAPLRILYHHRVAAADGMRVHINEVVRALRDEGHTVCVVGPDAAEREAEAGANSRLEKLADGLRTHLPAAVFEILELLYNIPAAIRLQAAAARFAPDVIYERYNLFLLAGLWTAHRRRLPYLLEVNSPLASERREFGRLRLHRIGDWCERTLWRNADVAFPVTEVLAQSMRPLRKAGGATAVAPNGAQPGPPDAGAAAIRARLGIPEGATVLGFVGFVRAWHGLGWAVEALADLPPSVHLMIIGDGPALASLQARAEMLGAGARLHVIGRLSHREVGAYMAAFDIALQTAATSYASPLKLFEYMALGRAILAPDQPNIREVLSDGRTARLFTPGSQGDFRAALRELCLDRGLQLRLGQAARKCLEETPYTWRNNARRIAAAARGLIGEAVASETLSAAPAGAPPASGPAIPRPQQH